MKKILNDRVVTLPGVFLRMVKVNNMEKYDYDKINSMHHPVKAAPNPMGGPGFGAIMGNGMQGFTMPGASGASQGKLNRMGQYSVNQLSSKHMAYNQLMVASGKGRKVDIGKIIKLLLDQKVGGQKKAMPEKSNDDLKASGAELSEPEDIDALEARQQRAKKKVLAGKARLK